MVTNKTKKIIFILSLVILFSLLSSAKDLFNYESGLIRYYKVTGGSSGDPDGDYCSFDTRQDPNIAFNAKDDIVYAWFEDTWNYAVVQINMSEYYNISQINFTVWWRGEALTNYYLAYCDELGSGQWQTVGTHGYISGTINTTISVSHNQSYGKLNYKRFLIKSGGSGEMVFVDYSNASTSWYTSGTTTTTTTSTSSTSSTSSSTTSTSTTSTTTTIPTAGDLNLDFVDDGYSYSIDGLITNNDQVYTFNTANLYVDSSNLTSGLVQVKFNNNTQYYEYDLDSTDFINETMEVVFNQNFDVWIKTTDSLSQPIQDVQVRAYYPDSEILNTTNLTLYNQRLTSTSGLVSFSGIEGDTIYLIISKDGYSTLNRLLTLQSITYSSISPETFKMTEVPYGRRDGIWVSFNKYIFYNRTNIIYGNLFSYQPYNFTFDTDYSRSIGFYKTPITNTRDSYGRYKLNLTAPIYWSNTTADNVTFSLYKDGQVIRKINFTYFPSTAMTELLPIPNIGTAYINILMVIVILVLSTGASLIFRNPNAGYATFQIAPILPAIYGIFYNTALMAWIWLPLMTMIYFILKRLRIIVGE